MTWGQPLGLDELMIINPGLPSSENYFLGDNGTVYQLQAIEDEFPGIGEFFLGEDGTLYQLQGYQLGNLRPPSRNRLRKLRRSSSRRATCRCRRQ